MVGLVVASFSAVRWFFSIPAAPWAAAVVILAGILIIYGLAVNSGYCGMRAGAHASGAAGRSQRGRSVSFLVIGALLTSQCAPRVALAAHSKLCVSVIVTLCRLTVP